MSIEINGAFLKPYLLDKHTHSSHKTTVELATEMGIHADGLFPEELIGKRRPSESTLVFAYRKEIYKAITLTPFSKVQTSLAKIRKSQDWSIQHTKEVSPKIKEGESLRDYTEVNFPYYNSVTNWFFTLGLKKYLVDPNAVMFVLPLEFPTDNSYLRPYPTIYDSKNVIDYKYNQYAIFLSTEKYTFVEEERTYEGEVYLVITDQEYWRAEQINNKRDFRLILVNRHELGFLPCRKLRAVFHEQDGTEIIYRSRLYSCLPSWDEAVREYSDMQASVTKHMFPTMVIHTNQVCKDCAGLGKRIQKESKGQVTCDTCKGSGGIPSSPYEDIQVRSQMANELPLPNPIAYYIDKDTGIIEIQDKRIDNHILKGYSAINFDFLAGLNQSGVAKELDRSELNAFIYDIAEDIISIFDDVYYYVNEWRYKTLIPEKKQRDEQLPQISVPEKYDIISENYLAEQVASAKTNRINPFIINALEIEYANKKFNTDAGVRELVKQSLELDPLPGLTEDEKLVKQMNGAILKTDYVISSYIVPFIRRAVEENKDFFGLTYQEKITVLEKYAGEVIAKNKTQVDKTAEIDNEPGQNN